MFKHESNTTILPQGLLSSPLNRNWFPIVSTRDHLELEMEFTLKFSFSEKATKIWGYLPLVLTFTY